MTTRIVLIDDETKLLRALKKALEKDGFEVCDFSRVAPALELIRRRSPDLIISDIRMPGLSGLQLLEELVREGLSVPVILMTAYSSVESAVGAMRLGARDYLLKPFEIAELKASIRQVLARPALPGGVDGAGAGEGDTGDPFVVCDSLPMQEVLSLVRKVAPTDSTVLLQGESGTGKELVARMLHHGSPRCQQAFVAVNCSAIPEPLFESELFGHVRGSFTNAFTDKAGLFQEAQNGTLFLDEIGDLAVSSQAKLLRVLQDGTFKRVGDVRTIQADVRIIAASNRDLHQEVRAGRFRDDLHYRLNVVEICLPPLRQRREDIPRLVDIFLERFARKHGRPRSHPSPELLQNLINHPWPGNVREMENRLERAVILSKAGVLRLQDVPVPEQVITAQVAEGDETTGEPLLTKTIDRIEEEMIAKALESVNWNYSRAAATLGLTRQNLYYKLKKYGLQKK